MTEPFLYIINGTPDKPIYSETAPVQFKNPTKSLSLIPMTSRIMSMDRGFFTIDEINNDKSILKTAYENTAKNKIRKNTDNDFISVRSSKTEVPCAAAFMLRGKDKLFKALEINISEYYIIFITPDEVLFAEKQKFKPTQIKKITANIKNKLKSLFTGDNDPVLAVEVFVYDETQNEYIEV